MKNLLSSEMLRLFKNKLFYALLSLVFLFGGCLQIYTYIGSKISEIDVSIDSSFFGIALVIGFAIAIFVSLFVGTEYSNGTFRNKIIIGKSRTGIYQSKLMICCFAAFLIFVSYYSGALIFGFIFNKAFAVKVSRIIITAFLIYLTTCAYIALYLAIAMNWSKKSAVAVTSLVITIVLFFTATAITSALSEPEIYPESICMNENGELVTEPSQQNPYYVSGKKRQIYEALNDINPMGQCIQLSGAIDETSFEFKSSFLIYSAGIIVLSTSIGIAVFKKKDIV
ncbi:MAG: ABC transporter permease subunit [Eubacterium sp.]